MPAQKVHPSQLAVKIPPLLRSTPAWIGHKAKKPVVLPGGQRAAKTNSPQTWRPFADAQQFYAQTYEDPKTGLGFVLQQQQGVTFIDFDHCLTTDGKLASWAESLLSPFLGHTYVERSLSGHGLHVLTLGSVPRAYTGIKPPGVTGDEHMEVYCDLRYVALTGDLYGESPATLAPMQAEVDAMLATLGVDVDAPQEPAAPSDTESLTDEQLQDRILEARSALGTLDPDMSYQEWLRVGMALHHGLGTAGLEVWDEWSSQGKKYNKGETKERWTSFRKSGITLGTLFFMAGEQGWRSPLDDPRRQFQPVEEEPAPDPDTIPFSEGSFQEWVAHGYQLWKPNPKQEILVPCFNEANLHRFFTHHEDWQNRLRFNVRTQMPEIDGEEVDAHRSYRALAQSHAFLAWTKRAYGVKTIQSTIQVVAERKSFDPIADWLRTLHWDGKARLASLARQLGIESTALTERCLSRWLIGAVARAMRPGCKMQNMLLLLGPQGRQKSGLLERLAVRPEWFHESHIEINNKEGYVTLDRKWIVEFAELDGLRKADVEKVKAFISESVSNYRMPYGRVAEDHPRHYVLAGTANQDEVLRDPTGARRFWPIRCPSRLNLKFLTPDVVKQIWAEAVALYDQGVRWWDEEAEVDEVVRRNDEFYVNSAADVMIAKIVEEEFQPHGALRMKQLVARLLELHVIGAGTPENTVGAVLRRCKWVVQTFRIADQTIRFWFPPTLPVDQRKKAAVTVLEEWKKSNGVLTPVDEGTN